MNHPIHNAGFTLLEALVTIVIVSIGLLGLLGLQTVSIVNTRVSSARTQATFAADNIADRMRANRAGVAANAYNNVNNPSAGSPPTLCENGTACTPTQMATYDAYVWDRSLGDQSASGQGLLPDGRGAINCVQNDGTACLRYQVTITWQERDDTSGSTAPTSRSFVTEVRP